MAATKNARRAARGAKAAPRRQAAASRPAPAKAVYGYCVVRGPEPRLDDAPAGLAGMSRPSALAIGDDLWLVAAEAPAKLYGPEAIAESSRDLDWLSARAVDHEAVVEHLMLSAPALAPLKLFTMFSSPQAARRRLGARRADLSATLDRLAGSAEWGVRVHARPAAVTVPPVRGAESGRDFLERKRNARDHAQRAAAEARAATQAGFAALARVARESRRLPAPPGSAPTLLLDSVFLVPAARAARFQAALERFAKKLAALSADVVLSGPWPPYHFVAGEQ